MVQVFLKSMNGSDDFRILQDILLSLQHDVPKNCAGEMLLDLIQVLDDRISFLEVRHIGCFDLYVPDAEDAQGEEQDRYRDDRLPLSDVE